MNSQNAHHRDTLRGATRVAFGDYTFDLAAHTLTFHGSVVRTEARVAEVLAHLIQAGGHVVTREELRARFWGRTAAADGALNSAIRAVRGVLKSYPGRPIAMIRGEGYRFDAPLQAASEESSSGDLIGRGAEMQTLRRAATACVKNHSPRVMFVTGSAGIGKSRLVQELQREWASRGDHFAIGSCVTETPASGLWPWRCVASCLGTPFVDALESAISPQASGDWYAYCVAARSALEKAAAKHPLLVIIEDLHLGDSASASLLAYLASEIRSAPLFIVATCRTPLPSSTSARIEGLLRLGQQLRLVPLSEVGAKRLLLRMRHAAIAPETQREALRLANGIPLFLEEIGTRLAHEHEGALQILMHGIPCAVREAIRWHVGTSSEHTQQALKAASIVGEVFDARWVARAANMELSSLLEALAAAVRLQLLRPLSQFEFRFEHPLLRQYIYESITELERRSLHWRVGKCALELDPSVWRCRLANIADNLAEGALDIGQAAEAAYFVRMAADASVERFAFTTAAKQYERALRLADTARCDTSARISLMVRQAECLRFVGNSTQAQSIADEALKLARVNVDRGAFAQAALCRASCEFETAEPPVAMVSLLWEALQGVPEECTWLRARVLAQLASLLAFTPQARERFSVCDEAMRLAVNSDTQTQVLVLFGRALAHWGVLEARTSMRTWLEQVVAVAVEAHDPETFLSASWLLALVELEQGNIDLAEHRAKCALERATQLENARVVYLDQVLKTSLAIFRGELEAQQVTSCSVEARYALSSMLTPDTHAERLCALSFEGDCAKHFPLQVAALAESPDSLPAYRVLWAYALLSRGETVRARRLYDALASDGFAAFQSTSSLVTLTLTSEVCAAIGTPMHASILYERLAAFDGYLAIAGKGVAIMGLPSYALGRLAARLGDTAAAAQHFRSAASLAERLRSSRWVERCAVALRQLKARASLSEMPLRCLVA
ncbi:MAG TPA: AAA family ATPase [Polyangiaceae bacterium]|nr:AAA family ATPase [Polyangiaceae bacterium]